MRRFASQRQKLLTLTEYAGCFAPHISMKPKASSKKNLKDFKDFKAFWRKLYKENLRFNYTVVDTEKTRKLLVKRAFREGLKVYKLNERLIYTKTD
jgi:hypothetical protein